LHRTSLLWGCAVVLLCAGGCNEDRAHGAGATVTTVGEIRQFVVAQAEPMVYVLDCRVSELNEPIRLEVEVSEDRGSTFRQAEGVEGETTLSVGESETTIRWYAERDLTAIPQGDVVLRVIPYGTVSGKRGTAALSDPFAVGENQPPHITSVAFSDNQVGSPAALSISASDPEGDNVEVWASYSTDGGSTYHRATLLVSGNEAQSITAALSPTASSLSLSWDARSDLGTGTFNSVIVKVSAADAQHTTTALADPVSVITYRPELTGITIEDIPEAMNGSRPFLNLDGELQSFQLLVPAEGFRIRITYQAHALGTAIDPDSLVVTADRAFGTLQPGTDLGPLFLAGSQEAVLKVNDELAVDPGEVTVTAQVADRLGNMSEPLSYSFLVAQSGQGVRPFAAPDTWCLLFDRDWWTFESSCEGTRVTITTVFEPNGRADFIDDLELLGLYNEEEPEVSAYVESFIKQRVLANLRGFFGIEEDGTHTEDSSPVAFSLGPDGCASAIAVGGADPAGGYTLGRAYFDWGNKHREQDTTPSLGVFSTNLIRFYVNTSYLFQELFDPFIPCRGDPVGTLAVDKTVMSADFVPGAPENSEEEESRYEQLYAAADGFGRAVAAVLAHEIGHSLGLVANGPPPGGLFGGESNAEFTGYWTDPYHIDTTGNNIMEAAMSFTAMQYRGSNALRFNELNTAYLRERILLSR